MSATTLYGVTYTVEAAFSADVGTYGAWDADLWDTATWGPDNLMVDLSAWVRGINTNRRFGREVQAWEAGSASIVLDNRDGRFSPSNPGSPYVVAGVTGIRPWRKIRIRAAYAGVTYDVYNGYALNYVESYVEAGPNAGDAIVTVTCSDELAALARVDGVEKTPQGAGEFSGLRVHRILSDAGHAGGRAVDPGTTTLQATTLDQNAVAELQLTADSEGGAIYINRAGTFVFENSLALIENSNSNTVQGTFGDGGSSELPYSGISFSYTGDLLVNIVSFTRVGGTAQTVTNETSRALYLDKRYSRTDLICETDAQAWQRADFYLHQHSEPEQRAENITVLPRSSPAALFPQVLGREVRDLIRVVRRPPGSYTISRDCHIAGISHTITGDNWVTTFDLWSADIYQGVGLWDSAVWDSSTWFY